MPINDEKLIDRVLATQPLVGQLITLLTYDTGRSTRARAAGSQTIKLREPLDEEPGKQTKTRRGAN